MYLKPLIDTKQTVFNVDDLRQIWQVEDKNYLKTIIARLFKSGKIIRIKRGVYAINKNYNKYELASKIKSPSYISLETVLQKNGIIFQDYSKSIYNISNNTVKKKVQGTVFKYFKIKDDILFSPLGIEKNNFINIASTERAIADRVYLTPGYYFDNLREVDTKKLKQISKIYNKRTQMEIKEIIRFIQKNYA
jgi:predicted transcriptional regulator of viral defense system